MEIKTIASEDFVIYGNQLTKMYIDTFSNGKSFQYHDPVETQNYLKSIFDCGYGIFAFDENQLVGAILLTSLNFDGLLPNTILQIFDVKRSIYVAEMMVEKSQQGHGIGKKLLRSFLETIDKNTFTDAFIRVWIENKAAVGLYKKMGFKTYTSIIQPKLLADKSGMFDFKKIYLHQKIN